MPINKSLLVCLLTHCTFLRLCCTKYYLLLLKLCCQKLTITQKLFSLHSGLLEFQNIMQRGGVWIWRLEHLPLRIARHFDGTSLCIWVKNLSIMYQYITEICVWCWFFFSKWEDFYRSKSHFRHRVWPHF